MPRESTTYSLRVVKAELILSSTPNAYVKIRMPEFEHKTDVIPYSIRADPTWNKQFQLVVRDPASMMYLEVKSRRHSVPWRSNFLCGTSIEVKELLRRCQGINEREVDLPLHDKKGNPQGYIRVALWIPSDLNNTAAQAVNDALEGTHALKGCALIVVDEGVNVITDGTSETAKALGIVLAKMKIFVNLMDELAKIHPYADAAWKVINLVYKTVQDQIIRDQKIVDLAQTMESVYSFVDAIKEIPEKVEVLQGVITSIFDWTIECANFIGTYIDHNFGGRIVNGNLSDDAERINRLAQGLVQLKEEFDRGVGVQNILLSSSISKGTVSIEIEQKLAKLDHAKMDASDRQACLEGTRAEITDAIEDWVTASSNEQNTLWLYGLAGSGKSALSTTVANRYRNLACLGAFIFFDRSFPERSQPSKAIQTLAYQLASFDSRIATTISAAIMANPRVTDSPIAIQCSHLLVEPLSSFKDSDFERPIVIILDALDECGNAKERKAFLDVFVKQLTWLPSVFRFVITSRLEDDISLAFATHPRIRKGELDIDSDENNTDISSYLRHRLEDIRKKNRHLSLPSNWPGESSIQSLINRASGLFIWASTACEFIDGHNPTKRLNQLLDTAASSDAEVALDTLYKTALTSAGNWEDEEFGADALDVLGVVLTARIPLSSSAIDDLRCLTDSLPSMHTISHFGCVLQTATTVRVLHPSFADFLMTRQRCEQDIWFVDSDEHNRTLGLRCLQFMEARLKQNMCDLPLDADVLPTTKFSEALAYACAQWIEHLCAIKTNFQPILERLNEFLHKHLLHWFEAMSMLGQTRSIVASLDKLRSCITIHQTDQTHLTAFIMDASKFVQIFALSIEKHPSLIYATAIPFSPIKSLIYKAFHNAHTLPTVVGGLRTWPTILQVLTGHSDVVNSVAFSPDGSRMVSASGDNSVRIWDAKSGAEVLPPLKGHTAPVYSVAFSLDSSRVVSGSCDKTVRVWDTYSGAEVLPPFQGHAYSIRSVAFSPDGNQIISGSDDHTVRLWDAMSGADILLPLQGHTGIVRSVVFSPDGSRIVSGSDDSNVRVWDANHGVEVLSPLRGHTTSVYSVAFSPDGRRIVSGSSDCTVRVWDAMSGANVLLLQGHTDWVRSVAFSSDSTRIVSGSDDRSVRVWDAMSGAEVLPPFLGFASWVYSVAFSPDGSRIVSGWRDATVRVWDATSGAKILSPLQGHSDWVTSVAFSPDGSRIVSSSGDKTVRVWNAKSGAEILPPLRGHTNSVNSVAFSSDGSRIVSGSYDYTVRVWDAQSGAEVFPPLQGHTDWVRSVAFSPDGTRIVSGSSDCTVRVWDAHSGAEVHPPLRGHNDWVTSVAFSPDGTRIKSCSFDDILYWDVTTSHGGRPPHTWQESLAETSGTKYEVLEDGWIMNTIEKRRLYQLPSTIGKVTDFFGQICFATFESSVAIGTKSGQVIVVHLPPNH